MEIQELISFTTIVQQGSFSKASKKLDYCQGSITVHIKNLERELGVPVVATAARKGEGLDTLRETLYQVSTGAFKSKPQQLIYSPEVEEAVQKLLPNIQHLVDHKLNPRWIALRLLDGDKAFIDSISRQLDLQPTLKVLQEVTAI